MRILMLGNSLTSAQDMPDILAELTGAEVVCHTRGGARLSEHLNPNTRLGARTQAALAKKQWDYVVLHEMSHGEAFLGFIQDSSKENGLYFLDEPEAALSPSRQLTLLYEMDQLARHGSQLIVATHSPILLGLPSAQIVSFDGGELRRVAYEETESYQITELFINNRERILHELLDSRV